MLDLDVRDIMARVITGDVTVADDLDAMASAIKQLADKVRAGTAAKPPGTDPGGVAERVQMHVVREGNTIQSVDAN